MRRPRVSSRAVWIRLASNCRVRVSHTSGWPASRRARASRSRSLSQPGAAAGGADTDGASPALNGSAATTEYGDPATKPPATPPAGPTDDGTVAGEPLTPTPKAPSSGPRPSAARASPPLTASCPLQAAELAGEGLAGVHAPGADHASLGVAAATEPVCPTAGCGDATAAGAAFT